MKYVIAYQAKEAIQKIKQKGYSAYLVGGCVRDFLMGKVPNDYDITTSARPEEIIDVFKDYSVIPTGIKHGTITVIIDELPLEITTYRIESAYSDMRHPDSVAFTEKLTDDLLRRDFTMNAIACDELGNIKDPLGGIADIKNNVIRCVGEANIRFSEDPLRILRAIRFAAVLGFEIEENTYKALFDNKNLLKNVSSERIRDEFIKLICGKYAGKTIIDFADILGVFIPEILPMKGFEQKNKHHIYDVLTHTAVAVDNIGQDKILRLSAFLHDFGKPDTFFTDDNGVGHFWGHNKVSMEIAENVLTRLKFDNDTKNKVTILVYRHDMPIENTDDSIKKLFNKITPELFFMLLDLKRADTLAHSPECFERIDLIDKISERAKNILEREECFSLKDLALNGDDIIKCGYLEGKQIGKLLNIALEGVIKGIVKNDKSELILYINDITNK